MLGAWESGRFVTYPKLPGWEGPPWSMLLTPGWRELEGQDASRDRRRAVGGGDPGAARRPRAPRPRALVRGRLRRSSHRPRGRDRPDLRVRRTRLGPRGRSAVAAVGDDADGSRSREVASTRGRARRRARAHRSRSQSKRASWVASPSEARARAQARRPKPLGGTATTSFGELLAGLSSSLLASTYQAGKLVAIRRAGGAVNTHFRSMPRPMGIAARGDRLGGRLQDGGARASQPPRRRRAPGAGAARPRRLLRPAADAFDR